MYGLTLVTPPAGEPLDLTADVKPWLRIEASMTDDDALITALIPAARRLVEQRLGRQLVSAVWKLTLDGFPGGWWDWFRLPEICPDSFTVRMPRAPLQGITSVQYLDMAGNLQTLDPAIYDVDTGQDPGRMSLSMNRIWPITRLAPGAVRVTFTAGYGVAGALPSELRLAMLLLVAHWYENREAVITGAIATALPLAVETLLGLNSNGSLEYGGYP